MSNDLRATLDPELGRWWDGVALLACGHVRQLILKPGEDNPEKLYCTVGQHHADERLQRIDKMVEWDDPEAPTDGRPWTVEQERDALWTTLEKASARPDIDVPTAMWGAATVLIHLRGASGVSS